MASGEGKGKKVEGKRSKLSGSSRDKRTTRNRDKRTTRNRDKREGRGAKNRVADVGMDDDGVGCSRPAVLLPYGAPKDEGPRLHTGDR